MTSAAPPRYVLTVRDAHEPRALFRDFATGAECLAALADWLGLPVPRTVPPPPPPTLTQPAPDPGPPATPPPGLRTEVWRSVRAEPGTAEQIRLRFPRHGGSSIRGRLSQLVAAGFLTRDAAGVYRGAP